MDFVGWLGSKKYVICQDNKIYDNERDIVNPDPGYASIDKGPWELYEEWKNSGVSERIHNQRRLRGEE